MVIQIIFLGLSVLFALYTLNRGIRLLQNKEVMLSVKDQQMVFSSLSPRDKRLFGWVHVLSGGGFLISLVLIFFDAIPALVYNVVWLFWAAVVVGGTPMMRRRSRYDTQASEPIPPMPTIES